MALDLPTLYGKADYQVIQAFERIRENFDRNEKAVLALQQFDPMVLQRQLTALAKQITTLQQQIASQQRREREFPDGGGGGGGGGNCDGGSSPTVEKPDYGAEVRAYGDSHPAELANSCLATGGSWDFMDGLVAHLQSLDPRFGFLGQRGDVNDPAEDVVSYYYGVMPPVLGSPDTYAWDVIQDHCGANPSTVWNDITCFNPNGGLWLPSR